MLCCAGAVVTSFEVMDDFRAFFSRSSNAKAVYAPKANSKFKEWHAVTIVGYHGAGTVDGYWLCLNSWGKDWGDRGLFRVSMTYRLLSQPLPHGCNICLYF
jgi:cathepsin B